MERTRKKTRPTDFFLKSAKKAKPHSYILFLKICEIFIPGENCHQLKNDGFFMGVKFQKMTYLYPSF